MESEESAEESEDENRDEFDVIQAAKQRMEGHNSGTVLEI